MMVRIFVFALVIAAPVAAGCGSDSGTAVSPSTTTTTAAETATTTTTVVETSITTTTTAAVTSNIASSDLVYRTVDGAELSMDIYTPAGEGPWPVVVAFHGIDSDGKDGADTVAVAEAAAAQGMVVFAPSWIVWKPGIPPVPVALETLREWTGTANCAVAFAQQNAAEHGGDPSNTVVYGFSAGAGVGLAASVNPTTDALPGCETDALPELVSGAVLGDGEYWLHSPNFDPAFEADPGAMQAELAALIDASPWPADLDAEFFLWVAEEGTSPRRLGDIDDPSGWFAARDPDGSIRTDLDRLDQLSDEVVTFVDAGQLLELRLAESGLEVTLDQYPGGHTPLDKVPEIVDYLSRAAAR